MHPKRRFWDDEQKVGRAFSRYFERVLVLYLGYECLRLGRHKIKLHRKDTTDLLFRLTKSSFGEHTIIRRGYFMFPKQSFWKTERAVGKVVSNDFQTGVAQIERKSCPLTLPKRRFWNVENMWIRRSKRFVWGANRSLGECAQSSRRFSLSGGSNLTARWCHLSLRRCGVRPCSDLLH